MNQREKDRASAILIGCKSDVQITRFCDGAEYGRNEVAQDLRAILEDTSKPHWERINKALALLPPRRRPGN